VLGVVALAIAGVWWARQPRRLLPPPPTRVLATAPPVVAARVEESPRAVEATPSVVPTATVVSTVTAAAATPEVASMYRDARAMLADPQPSEAEKLDAIETLAGDRTTAATDVLVESTRNASILVSMAAVKALAGRPCERIAGPLTALLADEEWQRRAWAAKILGVDRCAGTRASLAARRGQETDPRVTKLVDEAIKILDQKGAHR
jgi:hypothetical protein